MLLIYQHKKTPKYLRENYYKKVCSHIFRIFSHFAALCFKPDFWVFSEKLMAVLLKNGHFQNVHFLKVDKQIINNYFTISFIVIVIKILIK